MRLHPRYSQSLFARSLFTRSLFTRSLFAAMLGTLLLAAGSASAADPRDSQTNLAASGTLDLQGLTSVDADTLNQQRARQGVSNIQLGQVHSQIALHDNVVMGGHSGTNLIAPGAFDNARGFSTVIQNTGHNVAIQESMIVNVTIHP